MAVWRGRLGGTGFGSADQPEHWAWTDRRWLMNSDALNSKQGAWLGSKALGSEVLAKEALARRLLVRKMLARDALARKAQTCVHEQVSEYGRRP